MYNVVGVLVTLERKVPNKGVLNKKKREDPDCVDDF